MRKLVLKSDRTSSYSIYSPDIPGSGVPFVSPDFVYSVDSHQYVKTPFDDVSEPSFSAAVFTTALAEVKWLLPEPKQPISGLPFTGGSSCLITSYMKGRYLSQAMKSAAEQLYPFDEILVLCMDADSLAVANKIAPLYSNIRVISHEKLDIVQSRNFLLRESKFPWVFHLDGDDWISSDLLLSATRAIQPALVYSPHTIRVFAETQRLNCDLKHTGVRDFAITGNLRGLIHKSVFEKYPLDPELSVTSEDVDFWYRVYSSEIPITAITGEAYMRAHTDYSDHEFHKNSMSSKRGYGDSESVAYNKIVSRLKNTIAMSTSSDDWWRLYDPRKLSSHGFCATAYIRALCKASLTRATNNIVSSDWQFINLETDSTGGEILEGQEFLSQYYGCFADVVFFTYPDFTESPEVSFACAVAPGVYDVLVEENKGSRFKMFLKAITTMRCCFLSSISTRRVFVPWTDLDYSYLYKLPVFTKLGKPIIYKPELVTISAVDLAEYLDKVSDPLSLFRVPGGAVVWLIDLDSVELSIQDKIADLLKDHVVWVLTTGTVFKRDNWEHMFANVTWFYKYSGELPAFLPKGISIFCDVGLEAYLSGVIYQLLTECLVARDFYLSFQIAGYLEKPLSKSLANQFIYEMQNAQNMVPSQFYPALEEFSEDTSECIYRKLTPDGLVRVCGCTEQYDCNNCKRHVVYGFKRRLS